MEKDFEGVTMVDPTDGEVEFLDVVIENCIYTRNQKITTEIRKFTPNIRNYNSKKITEGIRNTNYHSKTPKATNCDPTNLLKI